jgi:hypothetical protein
MLLTSGLGGSDDPGLPRFSSTDNVRAISVHRAVISMTKRMLSDKAVKSWQLGGSRSLRAHRIVWNLAWTEEALSTHYVPKNEHITNLSCETEIQCRRMGDELIYE